MEADNAEFNASKFEPVVQDPWIQIEIAKRRIGDRLPRILLRKGRPLPIEGFRISYKCENLQRTGSFKERGALNALLRLTKEECKVGVVAASAGNHAQALAYHGTKLNIPVTVVMPTNAPIVKVENCRALGANVVLHGRNFAEAMSMAIGLGKEKGMKYINGYDHPDVIAGAGTCGLEILQQLPDVDAVVVPCGGGGLLAGVALAIKRINPHIKVIGVESEKCPSMTAALAAGKPVYTEVRGGTIADGLAVVEVGTNAFNIVKEYVDEVIAIPEHYISIAILHLLEKEKLLCEGAGCTGLAGILSGRLNHLKGLNVTTILCGGNIDMTVLGCVIERGLYHSGRMMQFDCAISDRVGGLAKFCKCLAETKASVKEIVQERPFIADVNVCSVHLTCEVLSAEHGRAVVEGMRKSGFILKVADDKKYDDVNLHELYMSPVKLESSL